MLKVVYADCECTITVKTGWVDSSRRIWHFFEDAAFKEGAVILKRDFFSFRVVGNTSANNNILSTPMGVDYVVIGSDMEVQPLITHNAA